MFRRKGASFDSFLLRALLSSELYARALLDMDSCDDLLDVSPDLELRIQQFLDAIPNDGKYKFFFNVCLVFPIEYVHACMRWV